MKEVHDVMRRLDEFAPMTMEALRDALSVLQTHARTGLPGAAAARLRVAYAIERLERPTALGA